MLSSEDIYSESKARRKLAESIYRHSRGARTYMYTRIRIYPGFTYEIHDGGAAGVRSYWVACETLQNSGDKRDASEQELEQESISGQGECSDGNIESGYMDFFFSLHWISFEKWIFLELLYSWIRWRYVFVWESSINFYLFLLGFNFVLSNMGWWR